MDDKEYRKIDQEIASSAAIVAEMAIQPISLDLQRRYLDSNKNFRLDVLPNNAPDESDIDWLEITQIGKPIDNKPEVCFASIQKILQTCYMPGKKLIFLIECFEGKYSLLLGIKNCNGKTFDIQAFGEYAKGCWNGLKCSPCSSKVIERYKNDLKDNICIRAITGVPSIKTTYDTYQSSTIDSLLSGMLNKNFYYLIIAEPVNRSELDTLLSNIRTISGTLESIKSFQYSESDGRSEQTPQVYKDSLTTDEKKRACKTLLKKALPFWGQSHSAEYDAELQKLLTPPTSVSTNKSINVNIVNKHIEASVDYLDKHTQRIQTCEALGAWRTGIYIMSKEQSIVESGAAQICSMASGSDSYYEPFRKHNLDTLRKEDKKNSLGYFDNPVFRIRIGQDETYNNSISTALDGLASILSTEELSYFINFPLRSVPGISVIDSCPDFNLNKIEDKGNIQFGTLLFGGSETELKYSIDPQILTRHALIAGINGSGKTNTIQAILNGISMEKSSSIPFLIIEPAKTEYVDWAMEYNKHHPENQINVFIPGCRKYRGTEVKQQLKLNPFEVVWLSEDQEPNVLAHIDRLKSVFAAAFPMTDILPVLMEDLIYSVYQAYSSDWISKCAKPEYGKTPFPTLNSMSYSVDEVISHRKYEEKVQMNMEACLNTRIDSLKRGWRGDLLNNMHSTSWETIFEQPTVINLSYVGDDIDKSFIMSLILQFLYEYRSAKAEIGDIDFNSNNCSHVTFIEEAHRVMSKCDNQELPQYKSAMLFSNMLSEIRAYGESMFLVDQVPTRLIPDALKNTNLKIVHRLVAEDDCKAMGEAMGLNDDQRKMIQKLLTGQCIVSSSSDTNAYWVKTDLVKKERRKNNGDN